MELLHHLELLILSQSSVGRDRNFRGTLHPISGVYPSQYHTQNTPILLSLAVETQNQLSQKPQLVNGEGLMRCPTLICISPNSGWWTAPGPTWKPLICVDGMLNKHNSAKVTLKSGGSFPQTLGCPQGITGIIQECPNNIGGVFLSTSQTLLNSLCMKWGVIIAILICGCVLTAQHFEM